MADDDDPVELSAHTLSALNEFYRHQALLQAESSAKDEIDEDWELSQFWYDNETSSRLANECLRLVSQIPNPRIACISCPTLYKAIHKFIDSDREKDERFSNLTVCLFEFDARFERYGQDFLFYDYRQPVEELLGRSGIDLRHSFDVVVADPPFLSEECVSKVSQLVRVLLKPQTGKIIFCTGVLAEQFVMDGLDKEKMKMCDTFEPRHKGKLGNEFRCYVNYEGALPVD